MLRWYKSDLQFENIKRLMRILKMTHMLSFRPKVVLSVDGLSMGTLGLNSVAS